MRKWDHLVEADRRDRDLERAAKQGDRQAVMAYLRNLKATGNAPDLSVVPINDNLIKLLVDLKHSNILNVLFSEHYPFTPRNSRAVQIVARSLDYVRDKKVSGVRWRSFYKYIRRWLERGGVDDREDDIDMLLWGSGYEDESIHNFSREETTAQMYENLWFPANDEIEHQHLDFGMLVAMGDHIDGGAIAEWTGRGVNATLFATAAERVTAWGELEVENQEHEDEAQEQAIAEMAADIGYPLEVLQAAIDNDPGLTDNHWSEWDERPFREAAEEAADDTAERGIRRYNLLGVTNSELKEVLKTAILAGHLSIDRGRWTRREIQRLWELKDESLIEATIPLGDCYRWALKYVMKNHTAVLVHGSAHPVGEKRRYAHAWVEHNGKAKDCQGGGIGHPIRKWREGTRVKENERYVHGEGVRMAVGTGNWGPWDEDEQEEILGRKQPT